MSYAWVLASCSVGSQMSRLFLDLVFPSALLLWIYWITSEGCLFYLLVLFSVCSLTLTVLKLDALWASLSGVQSSMTFVRLNVIGCCWGRTFNCPVSTHWLIYCALAHSSNGFRIASDRHKTYNGLKLQ